MSSGQVPSLSDRRSRLWWLPVARPSARVTWRGVVGVALLGLTLFVTFYHLDTYPYPDFDEGVHLLAAKALAFDGAYGFGPAIGPTILVPVALSMRLFGLSLLSARAVMTVYCLLSVAMLHAVAFRMGGWKTAAVATLLYLLSSGIMLIWFGRGVLGEVPATFFALAGILVWFMALDEPASRRRTLALAASGVLVGLAILTKNQLILLVPAWLAVWVFDRFYYRQAKGRDFLIPVACALLPVGAWYAGQWLLFPNGQDLALHNEETWIGAMGRGIFTPSALRMAEAFKFLTGQDAYYGWLLPACLYAGLRALRRSKEGLRWALLFAVVMLWLGWFAFLSVAWQRYAFLPTVLGAIFTARLLHDLSGGFRIPAGGLTALRHGHPDPIQLGRVAVVALLVVILARSAQGRLYNVTAGTNTYAQQMAAYIAQQVPPGAKLETFDPEVCFLSGHACHMPGSIMDVALKHVFYGGPAPYRSYHFEQERLPYLLVGGSSKFYHIYDQQTIDRYYQPVTSVGYYDLYRLRQSG